MKIKYVLIATVLTASLFTACTGNQTTQNTPGSPDYEMGERITTRTPNNGLFGDNINGEGLGMDDLTNDNFGSTGNGLLNGDMNGGLNDNTQLENRIETIAGINDCVALLRGNTAYVACQVNNNTAGVNINNIRNEVANILRTSNPNISQCYVTTDANKLNQLRSFQGGTNIGAGINNATTNNTTSLNSIFANEQPIKLK